MGRAPGAVPRSISRTGKAIVMVLLGASIPACDSIWGEHKGSARWDPPKRDGGAAFRLPSPRPGLKLVLTPNLPGVSSDDVPSLSDRTVEILKVKGPSVTLHWTGRTRVETVRSLTRREKWRKERFDSPSSEPPPAEPRPEYEEKEVGGTLTFPDFNIARSFLLPGLWPEGDQIVRDASALWLSRGASASLVQSRAAEVTLQCGRELGEAPVQVLFRRLTGIQRLSETAENRWKLNGDSAPVTCELNGETVAVDAYPVQNWLGHAEVAEAETSLLVLSLLPELPETVHRIPAPPSFVRTVFGYRIASIDGARGEEGP